MRSKEARRPSRWFRLSIAAAVLSLFGTACLLPALRVTDGEDEPGFVMSGWRLLTDAHWVVPSQAGWSWAANVCLFVGVFCLLIRSYRTACALAVGGFMLSPMIWLTDLHAHPLPGYFLWQAAVLLQAVAALYAWRMWSRPPGPRDVMVRPLCLAVFWTSSALFVAACLLPALYFRDEQHRRIFSNVSGVQFGWEALLFGSTGDDVWPWSANGCLLLGSACLLARRYRSAWILGSAGLMLSATTWLVLDNVIPLPGYFLWEASLTVQAVGSLRIWRAARERATPKPEVEGSSNPLAA